MRGITPDTKTTSTPAPTTDLLQKWNQDGYLVLDDAVDLVTLERVFHDVDALWTRKPGLHGLNFHLRSRIDGKAKDIPHTQWVELSPEEQSEILSTHSWRIHGLHEFSKAAAAVFQTPSLRRLVSIVFGVEASPMTSITFGYGSQQLLHQDLAVFHIEPREYLVGLWIAGEDITDDSGPLVYLPGSHKAAFFEEFKDYPWTNLRTAPEEVVQRYQNYVDRISAEFPTRRFIAKKGQAILWHGMLLHGGSPITNATKTRKSFVIHYTVDGANHEHKITGKLNW